MKNNIEYSIEDLILIGKFHFDITIEILKSSLEYMIKNKLINPKTIGIVSDFSGCSFLVKQKDLLLLKDLFLKHFNILGHLKFAQIITSPQIAQTMLFKSKNDDVATNSFSTREAAKNWINQEII